MCKYYAHSHPCGHVRTVFAAFCPPAALLQKPCGGGGNHKQGDIWATVQMDRECAHCYEEPEPAMSRSRATGGAGGRKKVVVVVGGGGGGGGGRR
ncbi:Hypothetical predicted protein [Lecanosticta acicola]|uniref:Uncharacterized protein n=1 Tax=Lecanosticta acicola TaxID=111012 RepID=A0AAI9E9E9_9PEZI|nr:Hypothetical predicted protein [Lecanosticta acicola]